MQNSTEPPIAAPAKQHRPRQPRAFLSVLVFATSIVITAILINNFIFQSYYVDGTSMTPTLKNNDRLIINKTSNTFSKIKGEQFIPSRGQIVVLDGFLVDSSSHNEQLIKRVIGLPNEHIVINPNGEVIVKNSEEPDGFNVDQRLNLDLEQTYVSAPINIIIPPNQIFVMGDNRGMGESYDSRAFGPVDLDNVKGVLLFRILPLYKTEMF